MSIKRQDQNEEYSVTADWLVDFANQLAKKSYSTENINNLRQLANGGNKFATIEEKMADIKNRIGFDLLTEFHKESELSIEASKHSCKCQEAKQCGGCEVIKTAQELKHKPEDIETMKLVIKYIQGLIKHEYSTLTPVMVIARCRQEPGLRLDSLPLNFDKLQSFIEKEFKKYNIAEKDVDYVPYDNNSSHMDENRSAEYWSHAFPDTN